MGWLTKFVEVAQNIEVHDNIVKYKDYTFKISDDRRFVRIGGRNVKTIKPYICDRNKKWKVEIQLGKDESGKRIRKVFYFSDYKEAEEVAIKMVVARELTIKELLMENQEKIFKEIEEKLRDVKAPEVPQRKRDVVKETEDKMPRITRHGKKWSIVKWENGKAKRYLFDTYEEAEAFAKEIAKQKMKEEGHLTLGEGVKLFAEYHFARKKDTKKLKYFMYRLNAFFEKWGPDFPWYRITKTTLENYITERLKDTSKKTGENVTESAIKSELKFLRAVWNYLIRNGYLTGPNYADEILRERKFEEKERKRALSYEETVRLLKGIRDLPEDRINRQKKGILWVLFFTGARVQEVFRLRKEHIRIVKVDEDEVYGLIHFTSDITKTGKERKIDIPYPLALYLIAISQGNNSQMLFPDFQTSYKQREFSEWFYHEFLPSCNIQNFLLHDFRHNWASRAEDMGTSMKIIKELGGWTSYNSAARYVHSKEVRNPMNKFTSDLIMQLTEDKFKELKKVEEEEFEDEEDFDDEDDELEDPFDDDLIS